MLSALDLNDVALFVRVVRAGSFAEASRQEGLPPNTVSRRIQKLEAQLGSRLLQRSTRRLTLTNAGERLHASCAPAVDGLLEAGQDLLTGSLEPRGLVRVAAMADFFEVFQMDWVADFLTRYPKVSVDFVLSDANADLIAERIDIALRGGPPEDSGYIGRQLFSAGSQGMVASPAYIAARGMPTTLRDLSHHDCLGFPSPAGHITWRMTGPDGSSEEVQVAGRFSANTAQSLRKATLAGLGIALLPPNMARVDLASGRLVAVLPHLRRMGVALNLLYPSRRHLPQAVSAFIDFVIEKVNALEEPVLKDAA